MPDAPRVTIFACGDPLRGDDAVGPMVAGSLPPEVLAMVDVRIVGALEPEHLTQLPAGARVVVVDAVVGPAAGSVVDMDLAELGSQARRVTTTSSHQLSLDGVVALAQVLRDEPLEGRFVGVGIGSVAMGSGPSDAVLAALPEMREAVRRAVETLSGPPQEAPPISESRVDVPGGRLAVHDLGSGPPIVLLHASIVDSWAWEPLTPFLLQAGYRVVAYDRRGSGASITEDVAFSHRADAIAVLDALGIGRACLVGNSMGALIAMDTAAEYPERCVAVIALAPGVSGFWPQPTPEEAALFDEMERLEDAGDADAIADLDVRAWVDGPGQPSDRVPAEIRELVREMDRANNAPGRVKGRPIYLEPPASERLGRLTMPILAVAGGLDFSETLATARFLEAQVPTARALIMPDVAHMVGLEAPAQLAAEIVALLAPLERWS